MRRTNIHIGFAFSYYLLAALAVAGWVGVFFRPVSVSAQSGAGGHAFHVSGMQLPGSVASPTPIEGTSLATNVNVDMLVIANTGGSTRTVTVQDCTPTTPFILFNAYSIPATTTWVIPLGQTRFRGCFKWAASSTEVMGTVTGTR